MAIKAVLPFVLMAASAAISAVGMISQGMAAKAAGDAQAEQYRRQAEVNRQQGEIAYKRQKREGQLLRGEQLSRMAAAGIDVSVGSPLELLSETAAEYEWRAMTDRWGHETQAVQNENRGALARFEGNQRFTGALFNAGAGLLGTAGRAFSYMGGGADPTAGSAPNFAGMRAGRGFEIA